MKKYFPPLILGCWLFVSCNEKEKKVESTEYENHYKFNSEIEKELRERTFEPEEQSHNMATSNEGIPLMNYQISAQ